MAHADLEPGALCSQSCSLSSEGPSLILFCKPLLWWPAGRRVWHGFPGSLLGWPNFPWPEHLTSRVSLGFSEPGLTSCVESDSGPLCWEAVPLGGQPRAEGDHRPRTLGCACAGERRSASSGKPSMWPSGMKHQAEAGPLAFYTLAVGNFRFGDQPGPYSRNYEED